MNDSMAGALAMMERTETKGQAQPIPAVKRPHAFNARWGLGYDERVKAERIIRPKRNGRSVMISSHRRTRIDIEGKERVYVMVFHPLERRMVETRYDGQVAEYNFDFAKWRELKKTDRLAAKLLYFYYRDIFGHPDKHSMEFEYLERRYGLSKEEIRGKLADAEREVCRLVLINNKTE